MDGDYQTDFISSVYYPPQMVFPFSFLHNSNTKKRYNQLGLSLAVIHVLYVDLDQDKKKFDQFTNVVVHQVLYFNLAAIQREYAATPACTGKFCNFILFYYMFMYSLLQLRNLVVQ